MSKREITVPMSGTALPNIDYARIELRRLINDVNNRIKVIDTNESTINVLHARQLNVAIQIRNIRNTVASLKMYSGLIEMLLQNMESDIKSIYISQKLWRENELKRLARLEEQDKEYERNERDKENKKKKASDQADAQTE